MATFFKLKSGTSVNVDTEIPTARKFIAPLPPVTLTTGEAQQKTNDQHVSDKAESLSNVASVADQVAAFARNALADVRSQLAQTPLADGTDIRSAPPPATQDAVDFQINDLARRIGESFPAGRADMVTLSEELHSTALQKLRQSRDFVKTFNGSVPNLENVTVSMAKEAGTTDCFKALLRFTLPTSAVRDGTVRAVRVFRATQLNPRFERGVVPVLTVHGMDRLMTNRRRSRSKNQDYLSSYAHKLDQSGVPNSVSILSPVDPGTNARVSSVNSPVTGSAGGNDASLAFDRRVTSQADSLQARSVSRVFSVDVNRPVVSRPEKPPAAQSNGAFREVGFTSLEKLSATEVGDQTEFSFFDDTVSYGQGYVFYVTSVDRNMVESSRSRLVSCTVEGLRVPGRPSAALESVADRRVAFVITCDDALVEKYEVYRRDPPSPKKFEPVLVRGISTRAGFVTGLSPNSMGVNGFVRVGESLNGAHRDGSVFYDVTARPGKTYDYRIYSVDVFGNKSESPWETAVSVPDGSTMVALAPPHVTAEVDSATSKVRVTFGCSDPRVVSLALTRRDATAHQAAFTVPNQPSDLIFGTNRNGYSPTDLLGPVVNNQTAVWPGLFQRSGSDVVFVDPFSRLDRVYQYRVVGFDRYGNKTSYAISSRVFVTRQPMIDAPINLSASLVQGPGFRVGGVRLSWQDGNSDVSSENRLGSQTDLADTAVRTLYQVQRKMTGEGTWTSFPLTPDKSFIDPTEAVLGKQKPGFRPNLVRENAQYQYRVAALQTGSFASNFTEPVTVFSSFPAAVPANFRARPSDAKVSPMYVMLNWDTSDGSGAVDRWEIQRAVTNNYFAAGISVKDPTAIANLPWQDFRTVFAEGSRFLSSQLDVNVLKSKATNPNSIMTGQHFFQDMAVTLGNTYVYRIRALGVDGVFSDWAYRGVRLADTSSDRRLKALVPPDVQALLAKTGDPIALVDSLSGVRSLDLQPTFSLPQQTGVAVQTDSSVLQRVPDPVLKTQGAPDVQTAQQNRVKFLGS